MLWNEYPNRNVAYGRRDARRAFIEEHLCELSMWGKVTKGPAVLVVEDEALIRLGAVRMIENAGFEVIEAAGADEAIQILESRSDIRVVFTDIHMPGSMDGLKLAHAVRHRWPPIKIVVTSGRELPTEQDLPEGGRFFPKPDDPTSALRDVARVGAISDLLHDWSNGWDRSWTSPLK